MLVIKADWDGGRVGREPEEFPRLWREVDSGGETGLCKFYIPKIQL